MKGGRRSACITIALFDVWSCELCSCVFICMRCSQASADICGVVCKRPANDVGHSGNPGLERLQDIETALEPRLRRLSVYVFHDPVLFTKLCRLFRAAIGAVDITGGTPEYIKRSLVDLLGALALIPSNAAAACELWESLKLLGYTERYWIYAEVHWTVYQEHPELVLERARCRDEMRVLLKSLTKDNVGKKRRALGKLSNSNPLVVGDVVVDYIQEWESMIEVCKEALLYCSSLALDVLSYLFLEELGGALLIKKGFLQDDNANLERWLVNLSSFISDVYVKYPRTEMKGLLQHLFNRLRNDAFGELVILRDLIGKMAGIRYEVESVSNEVLEARCGGERLRQQVENPWPAEFLFEQAKAEDAGKGGGAARIKAYYMGNKERKEASECLLDALQTSKLTMPILVSIAQQMADCAFTRDAQDKSQIRYTSWLHRQAQETLLVYADFLWRRMPSNDYIALLPKITDIVDRFHLLPELGLHIMRPAIRWRSESESLAPLVDLGTNVKEMLKSVEAKNPNLWKSMGPTFYATFWSLSLSDIHVPKSAYENQLKRLRKALSDLDDKDRVDAKARDKDVKKWRDTLTNEVQKLEAEYKKQVETQKRVLARLEKDKSTWLASINADYKTFSKSTPTSLLQYCVLPRCIQSPEDALFCAKLIQLLHSIKTPRLSTLVFYNTILNNFGTLVFSRTENEARHLGKFVCELLTTLNGWAKSETIFNKECFEFPGFNQVVGSKPDFLVYAKYQRLVRIWHQKLSASFCQCLESKESSEVHNALTILSELVGGPFPIYENLHADVKARALKLNVDTNHTHGNSITVMARSLFARLTSCQSAMIKLVQKKPDPKKETQATAVSGRPAGQDGAGGQSRAAAVESSSGDKEAAAGSKATVNKTSKDSKEIAKETSNVSAPEKRKEEQDDGANGDRGAKRQRGADDGERKETEKAKVASSESSVEKAKSSDKAAAASRDDKTDKRGEASSRDAALKEKERRSSPAGNGAAAAEKRDTRVEAGEDKKDAQRDAKRVRRDDEPAKGSGGAAKSSSQDRSSASSALDGDHARHAGEARDGRQSGQATGAAKEKSRVSTAGGERKAGGGEDRAREVRLDAREQRPVPTSDGDRDRAGGRGGSTSYSGGIGGRDGAGGRTERDVRAVDERGGGRDGRSGASSSSMGGGGGGGGTRDRSNRPSTGGR
jgi:THO complex subunit 2